MSYNASIKQLEDSLSQVNRKMNLAEGEYNRLKKDQENSKNKITQYEIDKEEIAKAVELLNLIQQVTREQVKDNFETVVTHALRYILDNDDYTFHLVFKKRGNLQELDFCVQTSEKTEPVNPLDSDGGGVNNILSLALRCVLLEIAIPKCEGFVIFDEVFANLSDDYVENASKFLFEINEKLGRQIIMISHQPEFKENHRVNLIELK